MHQPTTTAPAFEHASATDRELADRGRAGDRDALAEVFRRHYPAVVAAARRCAPSSMAEDLAAEAFARTFSNLLRGAGPDISVRAYLVTAVRNAYVGVVQKDHRVTFTDDIAGYERPTGSTDPWERSYDGQLAKAALSSLSERDKTVLWWMTVEGRSAEDLATSWGSSPGAIRQQAVRARDQLRLAYLAELVGPPETQACHEALRLLPRRARGLVDPSSPRARRLVRHLAGCQGCSAAGEEVRAGAARMAGGARV